MTCRESFVETKTKVKRRKSRVWRILIDTMLAIRFRAFTNAHSAQLWA